jgi:hypothetical protein
MDYSADCSAYLTGKPAPEKTGRTVIVHEGMILTAFDEGRDGLALWERRTIAPYP